MKEERIGARCSEIYKGPGGLLRAGVRPLHQGALKEEKYGQWYIGNRRTSGFEVEWIIC